MFNLTKQERIVLIFIAGTILLGTGIKFSLKKFAKLQPIYNLDIELGSKSDIKIDINSANIEDLIKISGIGPVLAERIVAYRNTKGSFKNIEDLEKVKGIGEKKLARIKNHIIIGKQNKRED